MPYSYHLNIYTWLMDKVYEVAPTIVWPTITLTSPQAWQYVLWQSIWPVALNATTVKGTNNIQLVTFRRWGSDIHTINPATAWWWLETYSDTGPFTTAQIWQAYVEDITGLNALSNTVSITFENYFYRGMDPNTALWETEVEALENNTVKWTFPGVYAFASELWSYKYFGRPTRLWQPSDPTIDFIDNDTGFAIPFQLQAWVVSITNTYGFTENYYIYRSVNVLWWALNIRVQP